MCYFLGAREGSARAAAAPPGGAGRHGPALASQGHEEFWGYCPKTAPRNWATARGKPHEEELRPFGLFGLEKRRLRVCDILTRVRGGAGAHLRSGPEEAVPGRFRLDVKEKFFTQKLLGHGAHPTSLSEFKKLLDRALKHTVQLSGLSSAGPEAGSLWSLWITSKAGYCLPSPDLLAPGGGNHGRSATGLLARVGLLSDRMAPGKDTTQLWEKDLQEGSAGHLQLLTFISVG